MLLVGECKIGYTTDFEGEFKVTPKLTEDHAKYLAAFAESRRMDRSEVKASLRDDPIREAVKLPIGIAGGYFVGEGGFAGQDRGEDIINYNYPPNGQPGLWCQWIPTENRNGLVWNGTEKFYDYVEWIKYLINHFLKRWKYTVNGVVTWQGESHGDVGSIIVKDNVVSTVKRHLTPTFADDVSKEIDDEDDSYENTRKFECVDGVSDKFWQVTSKSGNQDFDPCYTAIIVYGKNGTKGAILVKDFDSKEEMVKYVATAIREKLGKGYKEIHLAPVKKAGINEDAVNNVGFEFDINDEDAVTNSNDITAEMQDLVDELNDLLVEKSGDDKLTKDGKKYLTRTFNVWSKLVK